MAIGAENPIVQMLARVEPTQDISPVKRFAQTFAALRNNQLKTQKLILARDELRKRRKIEAILTSSHTPEGKLDFRGAIDTLRNAGFVEEAQELEKNETGIDKATIDTRKKLQDMEETAKDRLRSDISELSATFGSVAAAKGDSAISNAYDVAINKAVNDGLLAPEEIPKNPTVDQMKEFSQMQMLIGAKVGDQLDFIASQNRLEFDRQKQLRTQRDPTKTKLMGMALQKVIIAQQKGIKPDLTPAEEALITEDFGADVGSIVKSLIEVNPDFFNLAQKSPVIAANMAFSLMDTAKLIARRTIEKQFSLDRSEKAKQTDIKVLQERIKNLGISGFEFDEFVKRNNADPEKAIKFLEKRKKAGLDVLTGLKR